MKNIQRSYHYIFYKLFKFYEGDNYFRWRSDFKAGISIIALEIWFVLSLINYYKICVNRYFHLDETIFFLIGGIIIGLNTIIFVYFDKWKEYNVEFDQLPKKKNIIGGIIVWTIILFIIANLIYSFYLMSQVDWNQYK